MRNNYELVHRFYNERRRNLGEAKPNKAHEIVAGWERDFDLTNLTQNVDDLFERAGCTDVIHLHGELSGIKCVSCGKEEQIGYGHFDVSIQCKCGAHNSFKPTVVFFGEFAPNYAIMWESVVFLDQNTIFLVIGTSNQVINIERALRHKPCHIVWVNAERPRKQGFYHKEFIGKAAEIMPEVDEYVRNFKS